MTILPYNDFVKLADVFEITEQIYNDLDTYAELLVEKNKVMNLTGITEPLGISEKHFLDSLLIFRYADIHEGACVIDVGTGAGFPGVPMKLYRNDLQVTLLDSLQKRINFLSEVSDKTHKMECIHARAEEGGRDKSLREHFDFAVARAVAAMPVLCEYCLPFVKVGGAFIAMKGPNEDISGCEGALEKLGGRIEKVEQYSLPCGDKRVICIVRKISATPTKYPRNSGQIKKNSL